MAAPNSRNRREWAPKRPTASQIYRRKAASEILIPGSRRSSQAGACPQETFIISMPLRQVSERSGRTGRLLTECSSAFADVDANELEWPLSTRSGISTRVTSTSNLQRLPSFDAKARPQGNSNRTVALMRKGAAGSRQANVAAQKERPRVAGSFLLELGARAFWIEQ